ncbi:MAG TPA: hypothetical protein VFM93_10190 [Candidatus Limnocylindria bacterium]|nr:hypothetical protein [Candidatus Limnocylindria bacterium]
MRPAAILTGFLTDIGLTFMFSAVVVAIVGGDTPEEMSRRMSSSTELMLSLALVGLAFTGIGAYVAAAMAGTRHVEHGVAVGMLSLGLGLGCQLAAPGSASSQPGWLQLVGFALTVPVAALGGWYRKASEPKP